MTLFLIAKTVFAILILAATASALFQLIRLDN